MGLSQGTLRVLCALCGYNLYIDKMIPEQISSSGRAGLSPYGVLTGLCSSRVLLYLSIQSYPALIPILQREWGMSNAAAGSIVSAYQAGFLVSVVGLSVLTDWVSTKKVYLYSCLAFAVSCFLFALFARSYPSALLLRLLMGLSIGGT